jgi:hypothetical protein
MFRDDDQALRAQAIALGELYALSREVKPAVENLVE